MTRNLFFALLGGVVLMLMGSCAIVLGITLVIDASNPAAGVDFATAFCTVFLGLPFVGMGGVSIYLVQKQQRKNRWERMEARVLQAAVERNYRITTAEVAMLTDLSLEEARQYMEQLARDGRVSVESDTNGVLVYYFKR